MNIKNKPECTSHMKETLQEIHLLASKLEEQITAFRKENHSFLDYEMSESLQKFGELFEHIRMGGVLLSIIGLVVEGKKKNFTES